MTMPWAASEMLGNLIGADIVSARQASSSSVASTIMQC